MLKFEGMSKKSNHMPSKPTLLSKFVINFHIHNMYGHGHGHINLWRGAQGISLVMVLSMHIIHFMTKLMKQAPTCVIV